MKRPNYVREWIQEKKVRWRDMIEAKLTNSGWKGVVDPKQVIKEGKLQEIGLNASVDSVGNLSFNEDEEENSGRANEYEDYRGLDAAALEDSDDENISSAFKGALLKPEYTNKLRKDKNKVNDEFRYQKIADFDMNSVQAVIDRRNKIMERVDKEFPKNHMFSN